MNPLLHGSALLDASAPIPIDRPFTRAEAHALGVRDDLLGAWVDQALLISPLRSVYHVAQLPDGIELRLGCVRLAAPADAVITDRTAGWLHGASMVLAPNDHLSVPKISMFLAPGNRLRNDLAVSGERTFVAGEVVEIDGVRLTSRLRTTCDLGMQRHHDPAFGCMEAMMRIADFGREEFLQLTNGSRFTGYRWVRTLRGLAPHVCDKSQSPGESVLRLRWIETSTLPYPEPQIQVLGPRGICFLDMGVSSLRYAAEYDGKKWHGPERTEHDDERRDHLRCVEGWVIDVFKDHNIHGRHQDVSQLLVDGVRRARHRLGAGSWSGQDRAQNRTLR